MDRLRPNKFSDIVGQHKVKNALAISINSAKLRNDSLGHILIDANAGQGKTTISLAIANELGVGVKTVLGSNIKTFRDIIPTLNNIKQNEVLFIDEVHRINKRIAESLYTVLEDFRMDLPFKTDSGEMEILNIDLPRFTIIGATTEIGKLVKPFIDRFKLKFTLEEYDVQTIKNILIINSNKLKINLTDSAFDILANASRKTPRIANALLEWVRDYSISFNLPFIANDDIINALSMRGIEQDGSTENDRKYLSFLKQQNYPVGINTICSAINIDNETVENIIEPWLLSCGKIIKTSKGRLLK